VKRFFYLWRRIEDWFVLCSGGIAFVIMALTIVDVVGRYFFLRPLAINVELSELLMIVIIMFSIAGTQRVGGHVAMEGFVNRFKRMNRPLFPAFRILTLLLAEGAFIYAFYFILINSLESHSFNEVTQGPVFLIVWPFKFVICFGILLMCVRLAIQLIQAAGSISTWRGAE
jgi:TRAP-type C4-dicarboxylate transport system permease small subunit